MIEIAPVLAQHKIDEEALWSYLRQQLPSFAMPARLEQFRGGQSNPTYLVTARGHRYVLRKKPPGTLLRTAHSIEREYRVQCALRASTVPVAPMALLCEDPTVIGTAFYVMEFVNGRIDTELGLPHFTSTERSNTYCALIRNLAALHTIDFAARGLGDFGRPERYLARQLDRWSKQYAASRSEDIASMVHLRDWLVAHLPRKDEAALIHGDYRLGNVMFSLDRSRIVAVLDWELATIGHPLADVALFCLFHHLPVGMPHFDGLCGLNLPALGIPSVAEVLELYCNLTHRTSIDDWTFHLALAFYRLAAICQGIYSRSLRGNAADPAAPQFGTIARQLAHLGWHQVQSESF